MSDSENHTKIVQIIEESGILKPNLKLQDVLELGKKAQVGGGHGKITTDGRAFFIHSNFVMTHLD